VAYKLYEKLSDLACLVALNTNIQQLIFIQQQNEWHGTCRPGVHVLLLLAVHNLSLSIVHMCCKSTNTGRTYGAQLPTKVKARFR